MESIQQIPLSALSESPFNPRKIFNEGDLQELAQSIKAQGVMQPIVVRPLQDPGTADYTKPVYQLIFGHRRKRATELAGLESIPAIVREMTDEDAAIAQVHENTKRADVTAMEEADSFAHLHKAHKMSADAIAEAVGKSRSFVFGRLKLASAAPEVRTAIIEHGLSPETGLAVARLRSHNIQRAALKQLREPWQENASQPIVWMSVRSAAQKLSSLFTIRLEAARFEPTDAALCPSAGACSSCSKLAANMPDLDELPADTCTDKECFDSKQKAHQAAEVEAARRRIEDWSASGRRAIQGDEAKQLWPHPASYYLRSLHPIDQDVDDVSDVDTEEAGTLAEVLAKMPEPPATVLLWNPHDLTKTVECLDDDGLNAVFVYLGLDPDAQDKARVEGPKGPDPIADWTEAERLTTNHNDWLEVRRAVLAAVPTFERTTDDLRAILKHELWAAGDFGLAGQVLGWTARYEAAVEADEGPTGEAIYERLLAEATADELGNLIVAVALDTLLGTVLSKFGGLRSAAAERVALAERFGVNVLQPAGKQEEELDQVQPEDQDDAQADAGTSADASSDVEHAEEQLA